ncbi:hypothetical protein ABMA28_006477 [Loxostege sticticalis]|uniref:BTB domain-containing protein n=1 Tax=Loxostege sticticalis TaxID=481309 RepID=A0ABD0SLC5_LOXSC
MLLHDVGGTVTSPEYVISRSAIFQVKASSVTNGGYNNSQYNILLFVTFVKLRQNDDLSYALKFTSKELGIADQNFFSDDGTWHLIYHHQSYRCSFDVTVTMDVVPSACSFASLYEDAELTDFELRGEDGSVHMHRAVLAASSPVLRRMLCGTWRESSEGVVDVPGTSRTTLQYLKDYVYLRTLPETGLKQLLLLASYYMMPLLEQKCVNKLVSTMTAETTCDLLEFAIKHKATRLVLEILECVQSGAPKVTDIRGHCLPDNITNFNLEI